MYKIFLIDGDENDATDYYLHIISEAIRENNDECKKVYDLKSISNIDTVITIHPKAFFQIWKNNKRQPIIHWFQGLIPEEAMMLFENYPLKKYPRNWLYSFLERFILKRATFVFFVSEAMRQHYKEKYNYRKNNYIIMPCFNQLLNKKAFNESRYKKTTFVYAGSMSKWQCIDETLQIFRSIKSEIPSANLTLLTKEKDEAQRFLDKYGLYDAQIKYIPYTELNNELNKYKFGFIIREDNPVNNVATPTKMNSYLANGVIPIYSDYIYDFKKNLSGYKNLITYNGDINKCIQSIKHLDDVSPINIYHEYTIIFNKYYNENMYVNMISEVLKSIDL